MYGNYPNAQQQASHHHPPQQGFMGQYAPHTAPMTAHHQQQQMHQIPRDESLNKLKRLDEINQNIARISNSLIAFFDELTKEKQPPTKLKQTKAVFEDFLKNLKRVESDLLSEISNLAMASTGHQHEGSIYGARKDYDLAKMQVQLIAAQLNSLREALNSPLKPASDDEDDNNED